MSALSQVSSTAAAGRVYCNHRGSVGLVYYNHPTVLRHRNVPRNYLPISTAPAAAAATLQTLAYNIKKNNFDKYKPIIPVPASIKKNLLTGALFGVAANLVFLLLEGGGGGGNSNVGSIVGGGGGGGGGNYLNFWSQLFSVLRVDKEEKLRSHRIGSPLYMLGRFKKYTISDILFYDRRLESLTDPAEDPLFKFVTIQPGGIYTRAQLQKELDYLSRCGLFEEVNLDCKRNRDGTLRLRISFLERTWQQPADRIRCINVGRMPQWKLKPPTITETKEDEYSDRTYKEKILEYYEKGIQEDYSKRVEMASARPCLLPAAVQAEISDILRRRKNIEGMSARQLVKVREKVQQWYDRNGYECAQVIHFGNLNKEELVCEVVEGDITKIQVEYKSRSDVPDGNDSTADQLAAVVESVLPHGLRKGQVFNTQAAEEAKCNIDGLGLFSNTEYDIGLDEENNGEVVIKFKLEKKVEEFEQQEAYAQSY